MVKLLAYNKKITGSIPVLPIKMKTKRQLNRILKQKRLTVNTLLFSKPQCRSICLKLTTVSPKKPNSANRRIAKTVIGKQKNTGININVKIPGEGHNLQMHSAILVKPAKVKDLIGINHVAIRGKLDLLGVAKRRTTRSAYGVKRC